MMDQNQYTKNDREKGTWIPEVIESAVIEDGFEIIHAWIVSAAYSYHISNKKFFASNAYLAKRLGKTPRTIRRIIETLQDYGWLVRHIETSPNGSDRQIALGEKALSCIRGDTDDLPRGDTDDLPRGDTDDLPRGDTDDLPGGTLMTSNNKVDNKVDNKDKNINVSSETRRKRNDYPEEFEFIWQNRPKRHTDESKQKAYKACLARIKAGATWEQLAAGMSRYGSHCVATGILNTQYVKHMATLFGPNEEYKLEWKVTQPPQQAQQPAGKLSPSQSFKQKMSSFNFDF